MVIARIGIAVLLTALACCGEASAGAAPVASVFIAAPDRADMVYDERRDLVYISSPGQILRYKVASATFLPPVTVGGIPKGIDLSPDGNTLAVTDFEYSATLVRIKLVNLDTLAVMQRDTPSQPSEPGTWAVSYAADSSFIATTWGSGWSRMQRFETSGLTTVLAVVSNGSMVSASGDRQVIAFAEAGISDGRWGVYDTRTGEIVRRQLSDGTGSSNYEIATNAIGNQYAIPANDGAYIFGADYTLVARVGSDPASRPIGVAYHPVDSLAYFPWGGTSEVRVYDMDLFVHVGAYDVEQSFPTINWAYNQARIRLSGDGSLLMVTVDGGVRIVRMYAPLKADAVAAQARGRTKTKITLHGSVGNGGALHYEVATQPAYGRVSIARGVATYVATSNHTGTDSFRYRVRYGRASSEAVVTVSMQPPQSCVVSSVPAMPSAKASVRGTPLCPHASLEQGARL